MVAKCEMLMNYTKNLTGICKTNNTVKTGLLKGSQMLGGKYGFIGISILYRYACDTITKVIA